MEASTSTAELICDQFGADDMTAGLVSESHQPLAIFEPRFGKGAPLREKRRKNHVPGQSELARNLLRLRQAPGQTGEICGGLGGVRNGNHSRPPSGGLRFEQNSVAADKRSRRAACGRRIPQPQHRPAHQVCVIFGSLAQRNAYRHGWEWLVDRAGQLAQQLPLRLRRFAAERLAPRGCLRDLPLVKVAQLTVLVLDNGRGKVPQSGFGQRSRPIRAQRRRSREQQANPFDPHPAIEPQSKPKAIRTSPIAMATCCLPLLR